MESGGKSNKAFKAGASLMKARNEGKNNDLNDLGGGIEAPA